MSLINDALKKAQRQRDEGTPPATDPTAQNAAPEQLHRVVRREKPAGFRSQLLLVGGGAVAAVLLLGIGAMFFFRSSEQPAASAAKPTQVANPTPAVATPPPAAPATPAVVAQAPAPTPPPVSAPTAALPVAIVAPPAVAPAAPASPQFTLPPAPVAEVAPIATSVLPPAPTERPKASTRMIGVIEHYKVGGIRMAGADSKVLMNDKVYRINDIVDHELNIRLTNIEAKALTFEDSRGAVHIRTF